MGAEPPPLGEARQRLEPDMEKLMSQVKHIRLDQLMQHASRQLDGKLSGRTVVEFPAWIGVGRWQACALSRSGQSIRALPAR